MRRADRLITGRPMVGMPNLLQNDTLTDMMGP